MWFLCVHHEWTMRNPMCFCLNEANQQCYMGHSSALLISWQRWRRKFKIWNLSNPTLRSYSWSFYLPFVGILLCLRFRECKSFSRSSYLPTIGILLCSRFQEHVEILQEFLTCMLLEYCFLYGLRFKELFISI